MMPQTERKLRRPESVQVFLVSEGDGARSYLLFQRVARPDLALPAFWQGITGALEPGESFEEAAIREVREESGIVLDRVFDTEFAQRFPIRPEWRKSYGEGPAEVEERVFYGVIPQGLTPRLFRRAPNREMCSPQEARSLLDFGRNRECLAAVENALAQTLANPPCST